MIAATIGYSGGMSFDASKPGGAPRKLLDVRRLTGPGSLARMSLINPAIRLY